VCLTTGASTSRPSPYDEATSGAPGDGISEVPVCACMEHDLPDPMLVSEHAMALGGQRAVTRVGEKTHRGTLQVVRNVQAQINGKTALFNKNSRGY